MRMSIRRRALASQSGTVLGETGQRPQKIGGIGVRPNLAAD